jgi:phosphatidylserine decarboxylase
MEYFTRQLTDEKFQEIKSQKHELSIPCESTIESIGDFSDTSSILRLKKDTEDVISDLESYGVRDIKNLHFINMKLWKCFYHRVHSPLSGKVIDLQSIESGENFFGNNTLWVVTIKSEMNGLVYLLLVGELSIQDFNFKIKKGDEIEMYQELGNFDWGSQVVLIFDPSKFKEELNIIQGQKYFIGDKIF